LIVFHDTKWTDTTFVSIKYGSENEDELIIQDIFSETAAAVGMEIEDYNNDSLYDISLIIKEPNQFIILYNQGPIADLPHDNPVTISVPEEIPTFAQALRDALPGDTISLSTDLYVDIMIIQDASLTIEGRSKDERPLLYYIWPNYNIASDRSSLMVDNSNIVLKNLEIKGIYNSAFTATNSNVVMQNCRLDGVNRKLSRSYVISNAYPAFRWFHAVDRICQIDNCELIGGRGVNSLRGAAIQINNCSSSELQIMQSNILGMDGFRVDETYAKPYPGSCALHVKDSTYFYIELVDSQLKGGHGGHSGLYQVAVGGAYFNMSEPKQGANGLYVDNSVVHVNGGDITAGDSGDGGEHEIYYSPTQEPEGIAVYDGAKGGNGLEAINHSYVYLDDTYLQAGAGGEPGGKPGLPFVTDETSTVEFADMTNIQDWQLY